MLRSLSALAAGGALLVSSSAAAVEVSRTPAPLGDHEQIAGSPWVPGVAALIAALAIVLVITNDDDAPQSP